MPGRMGENGLPVKKSFRQRFLAPVHSRIRPTSPSARTSTAATATSETTSSAAPEKSASASSAGLVPSQPVASHPSSSSLLLIALQRLQDQDGTTLRYYISTNATGINTSIDQAVEAAQLLQRQCWDKRETLTLGNRTVTLRDEADKIVHWLHRSKAAGAANTDSVHIGLPWAGVRLLLQVTELGLDERASLLAGCEVALYMGARLETYADFHHRVPQSQARTNLDDVLLRMYLCILSFLAQAIRIYQSSPTRPAMRVFIDGHDTTDFETQCDELATQVENAARACDETLYQQYTPIVDKIKEFHTPQESVDRIEVKINLEKLDRISYAAGAEFDAYDADYETCHLGTRLDVLNQIMDWAQQPCGKRIFWLSGMAGTGKTTIAYTIAEQLRSRPKNTLTPQFGATFFFKRGENDRNSAKRIFPTIARRLAYRLPALVPLLVDAMNAEPDVCEKKLGEQFEKLLYRPVQALSSATRGGGAPLILVVIVDALDECDKHEDIETLLKLWPRFHQLKTIQLKLFVTGRPDFSVLQGLGEMPMDVRRDMALHDVPQREIREDITLYLQGRFSQIRRKYANIGSPGDEWPSPTDLQALVDLSVPLFISAATAYRFIGGNLRLDPRVRLQTLIKAQTTHHLAHIEYLYLTVLTQLIMDVTEPDDMDMVYLSFRRIVGSIIILAYPLSPRSLAKLLKLRLDEVQHCLGMLHAVLRVPVDPDTIVQTFHLSFREFLLSPKNQSGSFRVDGAAAHQILFVQCLDLLCSEDGLKEDICNVQYLGVLRRDIDLTTINKCLPEAMKYACQNWAYHARECGHRIVYNDAIYCFIQRHLLHWLEALSIMDRFTTAISALDDLLFITSEDTAVSDLLEDARRFALAHRRVAELAPLQLYSSARIFTHQSSLVRKLCGREPSWIRQLPEISEAWNLEIQKLEGHTYQVQTVAFSSDGQLVASAGSDGTVRIWDVRHGHEVCKLQKHAMHEIRAVVFSADNQMLASAQYSSVTLWDMATGREIQNLVHPNYIRAMIFSPDSRTLTTVTNDRTITQWSTSTGGEVHTLKAEYHWNRAVALSPDGQLLATAIHDHKIWLWDVGSGQDLQTLEGHTGEVKAVAFSPGGKLLASAACDCTVRVWDINTGRELWKLEHNTSVSTVAFSSNGQVVASASADRMIRLWDTSTGQEVLKLEGHTLDINDVAFSSDNRLLASVSDDGTLRLWDIRTRQDVQQTQEANRHTDRIHIMVLSIDGQLLVSASFDDTVRLWDTGTGQQIRKLAGNTAEITALALTSNSTLLATGHHEGMVYLWDVGTGHMMKKLREHTAPVYAVTFSPDHRLIASASYDDTISLWSTDIRGDVRVLEGHTNSVDAVAFSPDGKLLASAAWDSTVRLWEVATGREIHRLEGHRMEVKAVTFSPDGQLLLSLSQDHTVRVWNVSTKQEMHRYDQQWETLPSRVTFAGDDQNILLDQDVLYVGGGLVSSSSGKKFPARGPITKDGAWIQWKGRNLLWLPHEYRTSMTVTLGNVIAFGQKSGHVSFMRLDYP